MNNTLRTKMEAFDITTEGAHYPAEGLPERVIDGVVTWVTPEPDGGNRNRAHRMKARCPSCGAVMSAGRMHQHRGTGKCFKTMVDKGIISSRR